LIDFVQVEPSPENVRCAQEWIRRPTNVPLARQGFALLYIKHIAKADDYPISGNDADLCFNKIIMGRISHHATLQS
jgi:hypothetical protein